MNNYCVNEADFISSDEVTPQLFIIHYSSFIPLRVVGNRRPLQCHSEEQSDEESQNNKFCNQTLHYVQGDSLNVILSETQESQILNYVLQIYNPSASFLGTSLYTREAWVSTLQSLLCVRGGDRFSGGGVV